MAGKKRRKKRGRSYPGVYLEEVPSGSRPIEGVGTAVAAFVGFARRHPVPAAVAALATAVTVACVLVQRRTKP